MTSAQVVETSVKVTTNSPSQDYTHPDDHNLRTYDMTPGFKPFTTMVFLQFRFEGISCFREVIVFLLCIVLRLLFPLIYVSCEFIRFLHFK